MSVNQFLRHVLFLPEQGSTLAPRVDALHYVIILTAFAVGIAIAAVFLFSIVRYRRRSQSDVTPRIVAPTWLEGGLITFTLSVFILFFVLGYRDFVWASRPPPDALDVYVMGKQWMWKFAYPDGPGSVDVLYVPSQRPVRLLLTSRDVIHSFFVPAFRLKQDAVPGRYTQTWFEVQKPGTYEVLCAEYCGLDHSRMRATVVALPPEEFERWRREQLDQASAPPLAEFRNLPERGRAIAAEKGCLNCHTVDGTPHIGPTWRDLYERQEKLTTGEIITADVGYLTESMMDPRAKIVAGFDPVMPSFEGRLSAGETAAIVEYIRSLKSPGPFHTPSREPVYEPVRQ